MAPIDRERAEVLFSGLFEEAWYLGTYPDVQETGLTPLDHYCRVGRYLHRSPGPRFDAIQYLEENGDVALAGIDPLLHFLRYGKKERRKAFNHDRSALTKQDSRRLAGRLSRRPGRPTVMVCAHVAAEHLFGSERSLLDILDALGCMDINIVVTIPAIRNTSYLDALLKRSIAVYVMPYGWWRAGLPVSEHVIAAFSAVIAAETIDVVHVNTIVLREPLLAARYMGVRSIVHIRELIKYDTPLQELLGAPAQEVVAKVWESADLLIANSLATAAGFESEGRMPELVYNTADMDRLLALDPPQADSKAPLRVAMISSNIPKKGLVDFCEVAQHLYKHRPEVRFLLVGPQNEHTNAIASKVGAGSLPKTVEILGYRENPAEAISEADVVLSLSSFQESFGRTVLEGMAASRPAIVYDHGAPPELVQEGVTGFVVPVGDTRAVADVLIKLADNPQFRIAIGMNARKAARDKFGSRAYQDQMRSAYDKIFALDSAPQKEILRARANLDPLQRSSLKVAYFMWHFPVPSETFVLNELRILKASGIDVKVFCRQSPYPDFKPDFNIEWELVRDPAHLAERLRATGRNVVHSHFVYPTVTEMVLPACEVAEIPFTFIAHAQDIFRFRNDALNRVGEVSTSKWCRKVFVPSHFHFRYLSARGVPESKMMLSPNGCDETLYESGRVKTRHRRPFRRIVAIHRFTEKKGLVHLIRAAKLLQEDRIQVALYGYGHLEKLYRDIVKSEGITNVEFCGPVKDRAEMLDVFRSADLFACPSIRASDGDMDGIPTVVMEAIAAGLPVITTAISGIPDLIDDGVTGIICDADEVSIANRVIEYYSMPDGAIEAIIENALDRIRKNYNSERLVEGMLRVWANQTIDLMIVSWNNLPQLREVTSRLISNTSLPYHLIICDNGSRAATLSFLIKLQAENERVTLVLNRENAFVGPGTNICLEQGFSDYAVYVCGKEGMTLRHGWEQPLVHYMDCNPRTGQAGTLCYSPSYLRGRDYPNGVPVFEKFRNKGFAHENPDRIFSHVQGGFFILRRQMIDEDVKFSQDVAHNYTDVEFSYFVESCGWEIGEVAELKSLFNKTRPGLFHRIDDTVGAVHPPTIDELPALDCIASGTTKHCTVCATQFSKFLARGFEKICPNCGADQRARSIHRYLAESNFLFRRLPALGVNIPDSIHTFWKEQFQGPMLSLSELSGTLAERGGRLDHNDGRLSCIVLNDIFDQELEPISKGLIVKEAHRLLSIDGVCIIAGGGICSATQELFLASGLEQVGRPRYVSKVVEYDWQRLNVYKKR